MSSMRKPGKKIVECIDGPVLLLLALLLVAGSETAESQPQRIDPFSPFAGVYENLGEITVDAHLWAVGDINNDSLSDIVVCHVPDTTFQHFSFERTGWSLIVVTGSRDSVPDIGSGFPIGKVGRAVQEDLIAWGDWDANGNVDLAVRSFALNDTIYGVGGGSQYTLIIYWGGQHGRYSDQDTTHLHGYGDAWGFLCDGMSGDIDLDGVEDLYLGCGYEDGKARLIGGGSVPAPTMSIFRGGKGQRWGRDGVSRRADWEWWSQPQYNRLGDKLIDQDCDGAPDVLMYHDRPVSGAAVSILYGTPGGGLPDTNNIQTLKLTSPGPSAESCQLLDVTGDAVLDLVYLEDLGLSDDQYIRLYPGEPGERILALYGDGSNPWASIPTPQVLHDGWGGFQKRVYDLGDANNDGFGDLYFYHHPFFLSYNTGERLDSLIDGYHRFDGSFATGFVNVGDIDGGGRDVIAVQYPGGVRFLSGGEQITNTGVPRFLPHPRERRCFSTVSVEEENESGAADREINLSVQPNPASSTVAIAWSCRSAPADTGLLSVIDARGRLLFRRLIASAGRLDWEVSQIPRGSYHVLLRFGKLTMDRPLLLQR